MANINQNGINFNNYKTTGWELGGNPLRMPIQGPDEDGGIINAVDIDWNGAQVGNNVTINTTGELLSWVKNNPGPQGPQGEPGTWDSSSMLGYQSIDLSGALIPNGNLENGDDKIFDTGATMEDLLNYIGDLQHEIYVLSAAVISLANRNA